MSTPPVFAAYLIAGTGIFYQPLNGRRTFEWNREKINKVITTCDYGIRARAVFELLKKHKIDLMVIVNSGGFSFEIVKHVADIANEYATTIKVIESSMAKLSNIINNTPNMDYNKLRRGDTIFVTTFPYDLGSTHFDTNADYFILKKGKSSYRVISNGYLDIESTKFEEINHDFFVFLAHDSQKPLLDELLQYMDQSIVRRRHFDRYDYFLLHGALYFVENCLGFHQSFKIESFVSGIEAIVRTKTGSIERRLIVKHGELLPTIINGLPENNYTLHYIPHLIKAHDTLTLQSRPINVMTYNLTFKDQLLYYINLNGIPLDRKPENDENFCLNDDDYLSESDGEYIQNGQWNDFPFPEYTKLVVCIDLESGLALFQDYKTYGKHYIKRLWAISENMTKETCEIIFARLPKIYKYRVINIIGDLDDDSFKNAQHLQLIAPTVQWIPPLEAELMHIIRLVGCHFQKDSEIDIMIQRNDDIQDYYHLINKDTGNQIINHERSYTGEWKWDENSNYRIAVYPNLFLGEGRPNNILFENSKEDYSDASVKLSKEELRLFGAFADAKLNLKKCDYQKLIGTNVKIDPIMDSPEISMILKGNNIRFLIIVEDLKIKIDLVSDNARTVIKNSDDNVWTPLYFAFVNDIPEIGSVAKNYYKEYPDYVIFDLFKYFGKPLDDVKIDSKWNFGLVETNGEMDVIMSTSKGKKQIPVKVIFGCILKAIIKYAETRIDSTINVIDLKLPPHITDTQKNLIKTATILYTQKTFGKIIV